MQEERDQPGGFRVVDRRNFSADGTRREVSEEEEEKTREAPSTGPRPAPPRREAEEREEQKLGAAGFETLVSYLSTTAMFQLGLLPGPGGERIPPDLANARRTIDLLAVLQEKTRGNLTSDEAKLLDDVLYELRLSHVEMEKHLARRGE